MRSMRERSSVSTPLLVALLVLPVLLFYAIVAGLNTNLPTEDDFHGLFGFALRWMHTTGNKLPLIFSYQHNEYKMPLLYSLLSAELTLTHSISIPLWIWTGNLLALLLLIPLWLACAPDASTRVRLLFFVPVVWVVMSLGYAETVDFALSGLQVLAVVLLSLCSLASLASSDTKANLFGCVFALLACMIYANAFLLAPAGAALLWQRRKFSLIVPWSCSFAVALAAFLYHYHPLPHPWAGTLNTAFFFLAVVGSPFGVHGVYLPAVLGGTVLLVAFACLMAKRSDRAQPFAFWSAVWLLLGFVLTAYGRAFAGVTLALSSRYKIYGDLFIACLYLQTLALARAGQLRFARPGLALRLAILFAGLFGLFSDALGFHRLRAREVDVLYGTGQYVRTAGVASPMVYPRTSAEFAVRTGVEDEARDLLTRAINEGLYRLPAGL